ncbi:MAG: hypothetical protein ABIR62_16210 [Dokdonella sp.]|uniref:hypothetical protein n=1 Tax=Dokdonella sp. TaxID=2291710 RepID=UPI003262FDF0
MNFTGPTKLRRRHSLSILFFLLGAGYASASTTDTFALSGVTIASGGIHEVSNACFVLSSTIGQPVAGFSRVVPIAARNFVLISGFWGGFDSSSTDSLMHDNFEVCQ